jgi:phosphoenolpyruvate carboxylase
VTTDENLSATGDLAGNGLDTDLRADIRRIGVLLGQTLARQEGQPCSTWSKRYAAWSAPTAAALRPRLSAVDLTTATLLARAFSMYFHLANITEQAHRARELRRLRAPRAGGWTGRRG